ncbi:MAG TPA: metal-sensitive transcriptional regulator [Candidatus Dormibacteraeota bacterium]|nr:metal-sensitive transcriptional regulator [Candidatus Dormibacteraeota bacterium]
MTDKAARTIPATAEEDLIKALRRIEGQARGIQAMIRAGRECDEVVQQLAAVRNAVDRVSHRVVAAKFRECLAEMEVPESVRPKVERGLAALAGLRT